MFRCVANPGRRSVYSFHVLVSKRYIFLGAISLEGTNADSDRGHVYFSGRPLCAETSGGSTTWDINASNVVCRMLGFPGATSTLSVDGCPYGGCPNGIPFGFSGFKCIGNETHILECPHDETVPSNCGSSGATSGNLDIIGVECAPSVTTTTTPSTTTTTTLSGRITFSI